MRKYTSKLYPILRTSLRCMDLKKIRTVVLNRVSFEGNLEVAGSHLLLWHSAFLVFGKKNCKMDFNISDLMLQSI